MNIKKMSVLVLCLSAVILTACNTKSDNSSSTKDTENVKVESQTKQSENDLNELHIGAIKGFEESREGNTLVFDTLTKIDNTYKPLPNVIYKWESNDEHTEYDIYLKEGIKFHDGTSLDAETVKWDIENEGNTYYCSYVYLLDSIEKVDDTHLKIKLTAPYLYMLEDLSKISALPKDGMDNEGNRITEIGTGAFKFVSTDAGEVSKLEKNKEYWNQDYKTDIDTIYWHSIPDEQTRKLALESGQIDVIGLSEHYISMPYSVISDIKKDSKFEVIREDEDAYTSVASIDPNWKQGKMADKELRLALTDMFDRNEITKDVMFNIPVACGHLYNPKFNDGPKEETPFTYNEESAKKHLENAGYTVGNESTPTVDGSGNALKLKLVAGTEEYEKDLCEYLQSAMSKYGIEFEINNLDSAPLMEILKNGDYDLHISHPWFVPLIDSLGFMGDGDTYTDYGLGMGVNDEMKLASKEFIETSDENNIKSNAEKIWKIKYSEGVSKPLFADIRYIIHNKKYTGFHFDGNIFQIDLNGVTRTK